MKLHGLRTAGFVPCFSIFCHRHAGTPAGRHTMEIAAFTRTFVERLGQSLGTTLYHPIRNALSWKCTVSLPGGRTPKEVR